MTSAPEKYPLIAMAMHWLTLMLVIASFSLVWYADGIDDRELHKTLIFWHRSFGLTVLLFTAVRLLLRPFLARPAAMASGRAERHVATATHGLLYVLMLGIPMAGWLLSNAAGRTVSWFALVDLPALLARNRDLADQLHDLHEALATGLLVLIALHSLAALWHHLIRKDETLMRMLPFSRKS